MLPEVPVKYAILCCCLLLGLVGTPSAQATDPPPPGGLWNYSITPYGILDTAYQCVIGQLPENPATNTAGWAPSEGEFFSFDQNGGATGPYGLAKLILDCIVPAWQFPHIYCFENPTPYYHGVYPDIRVAEVRIFQCAYPPPLGTVWQYWVHMRRQAYFPPPLMQSGFEP